MRSSHATAPRAEGASCQHRDGPPLLLAFFRIDANDVYEALPDSGPLVFSLRPPRQLGQQAAKLATVRDARWKLHVLTPGIGLAASYEPGDYNTDPRAPDGVGILAPHEQATPDQIPGLMTGDAPEPMQLFDLHNDPGEQHDVAAQHADIVERLGKAFDEMEAQPREHPIQSATRLKPTCGK